jgi:hypothetical protein
VKLETIEDIKANLERGRGILTGSNKIDWNATKENDNKAVIKSGSPGHFFTIIHTDDLTEQLICMNSY